MLGLSYWCCRVLLSVQHILIVTLMLRKEVGDVWYLPHWLWLPEPSQLLETLYVWSLEPWSSLCIAIYHSFGFNFWSWSMFSHLRKTKAFQPLDVLPCLASVSHGSNNSPLSLSKWTDLIQSDVLTDNSSDILRSFAMTLIYFPRLFSIIFLMSHANLSVLIVLEPLVYILHLTAAVEFPSATFNSFQTLITKDWTTFRKQAVSVSLCCTFTATITVYFFIWWVSLMSDIIF